MLILSRDSQDCRRKHFTQTLAELAPGAAGATPRLRLLALLLSMLAGAAHAGQDDALHPFAALSYAYEDNLLRVPVGQPAFDNTLGDSIRSAIGGFAFDKDYGRQHIHADAKLTKVSFDHFSQLNYDGKDLLARWNWQLGNDWSGVASSSYSQVLAPYTDLYTSEQNLRVQRQQIGEASWRFLPSWRVRTSVNRNEFSYSLASQRFNDRTETAHEAELDYLASSGSWIGLVAGHLKGSYENNRVISNVLIDPSFDQDEVKASIYWLASGTTQVSFLGGWTKRSHAFFNDRDSKGATGRLTVNYNPPGTLQYKAAVWREFSALESNLVSYSLNNGLNLGAIWSLSDKLRANASYNRERRHYTPNAGLISTAALADSLVTSSLGLDYTPRQSLQLSLSGYHQSRSGVPALGTGTYKANGLTLSATLQF